MGAGLMGLVVMARLAGWVAAVLYAGQRANPKDFSYPQLFRSEVPLPIQNRHTGESRRCAYGVPVSRTPAHRQP